MGATPGPWHCSGLGTDHGRLLVVGADGYPIAYMDMTRTGGSPRAVDEANARLTIAAPALLAALIKIEDGRGRFSRDPRTHCENPVDDMRTLARVAIEEATGSAYPDTTRETEVTS